MALTTEEMLLLNNLMYLDQKPITGQTVEEWLNGIDVSKLGNEGMTSHEQWEAMINQVKSDPQLMNMEIADSHTDKFENNSGGGYSAVLVNKDTKDAVVCFAGTNTHEWKDNFVGGGATDGKDGVSTKIQERALEWYKEQYAKNDLDQYNVTVTGHSKGGNKAKYITLMDDSVDNCVSFNGQGFSDEFVDEYSANIAMNQHKIHNHNIDNDYVNLLLNDVGDSTFYRGYDMKDFFENHCADSFFKTDENGNLQMVVNPNGQSKEMQELDQFLNSCLRSLDPQSRQGMLNTIGTLVQAAASGKDVFAELASDPEYSAYLGYFLAYTIKYQQENPELMESIQSVFVKAGMDNLNLAVKVAKLLMEHNFVRHLLEGLGGGISVVLDLLKSWGVDVPADMVKQILKILGITEAFLRVIEVEKNGKDKRIGSANGGIPADFHVNTGTLQEVQGKIEQISLKLDSLAGEMQDIYDAVTPFNILGPLRIKLLMAAVKTEKKTCDKLSRSLSSISSIYEKYEEKILSEAAI